jgi:putative ABC transport system permease protein
MIAQELTSLLKLGWRGIWRNRRRTLISMSAIGFGLALVVFYSGLVTRMMGDAKHQLDNTGLGHVEISASGWRQNRAAKLVLEDADADVRKLALAADAEVSTRLLSRGLLSSARSNEAVEVHGVDWQREERVAGYLRDDAQGILVGEALAKRMNLKVGHKLRLMVQRANGEMGAALFRVRGVFHSINPGIEKRRVLISHAAAADLLGTEGAHQIVIQLQRAEDANSVAAAARTALGARAEVLTYAQIYPIFESMESLINGVIVIASLFVYFLVGLGVLNTMLMSVLERTREFGIMQAIGTRPRRIVLLVLAESFWIATLSVILGLAVGVGITWFGSKSTIMDFSKEMGEGIEFGGATIAAAFSTELSVRGALQPALYVYVMAIVVALYPAWRVSRMAPVDALRAR